MLTQDKTLRLLIEFIFALLGGLMIWIGVTGRFQYGFDPSGKTWLILSIAFLLWGARALYRPPKYSSRLENWARGLSLLLVGVLMIGISRAPFRLVGPLLATVGVLLLLRGLAGSMLVFRRN